MSRDSVPMTPLDPSGELRLVEVPAAEWRTSCVETLDGGGRFLALYAARLRPEGASGDKRRLVLQGVVRHPGRAAVALDGA